MSKETALKRIGRVPIPEKGYTGAGQLLRGNAHLGSMESATIDIPARGFIGFHVDADGNLGIGGTTATNGTFIVDADTGVFGAPNGLVSVTEAHKTADQTINNDSTVNNDTHLFVSFAANKVYLMECFVFTTGNSTADIKYKWVTDDASGALSYQLLPSDHWAGGRYDLTDVVASVPVTANVYTDAFLGRFTAGGTASILRLKWAQDVATVADTTVLAGSYIRLTQIA